MTYLYLYLLNNNIKNKKIINIYTFNDYFKYNIKNNY